MLTLGARGRAEVVDDLIALIIAGYHYVEAAELLGRLAGGESAPDVVGAVHALLTDPHTGAAALSRLTQAPAELAGAAGVLGELVDDPDPGSGADRAGDFAAAAALTGWLNCHIHLSPSPLVYWVNTWPLLRGLSARYGRRVGSVVLFWPGLPGEARRDAHPLRPVRSRPTVRWAAPDGFDVVERSQGTPRNRGVLRLSDISYADPEEDSPASTQLGSAG